MFVRNRGNRFSLLLLEEGEYYFEDYSATYYPSARSDSNSLLNKREGRLKLCSNSVLFDPSDNRYPILKFSYDNVIGCGKWSGTLSPLLSSKTEIFVIRSEGCVSMKEGNANHPYRFSSKREDHRFSLTFESLSVVLPKIQNLLRISQLHFAERQRQLQQLIERREESIGFNHTWLVSLSEKTILETSAKRITPLEANPGRVLLTDQNLYFQQLNNIGANPVDHFPLTNVIRVLKRRHTLRPIGLEVIIKTNQGNLAQAASMGFYADAYALCLSFSSTKQRDQLYSELTRSRHVQENIRQDDPEMVLKRWQERKISNYEYLMYLNMLADRSFNDITQYPVFPWVIADYKSTVLDLSNPDTFRDLSKPIGALNSERLQEFKNRYESMPPDQPKFLYGTHYSTPGYVLFFLVREAPEYMLRLQNGRFDSPDRMFWSIADTWHGVTSSPADVKELIPEFFGSDGDFLLNVQGLNLGIRSCGEPVGDVVLPPWAKSPRDFVAKMREALECEHVSAHLHEWIDLIFGHKQRGEAAVEADNLFYHTTYEGAVDIDSIVDPVERAGMESQINEFGQTPKQLLTMPHPPRNQHNAPTSVPGVTLGAAGESRGTTGSSLSATTSAGASTASSSQSPEEGQRGSTNRAHISAERVQEATSDAPAREHVRNIDRVSSVGGIELSSALAFEAMVPFASHKLHSDVVSSVCISSDGESAFSVSEDSTIKIYSAKSRKLKRSAVISELALSCACLTPDNKYLFVGSWDNSIYMYSIPYGRVEQNLYAHHDAVSCLSLRAGSGGGGTLASGSWDGTVKIWNMSPSGIEKAPIVECVDYSAEIKCIDHSPRSNVVVCGAADGGCLAYDIRTGSSMWTVAAHEDSVNGVALLADDARVVTCSDDGKLTVRDVSCGRALWQVTCEDELRCVAVDGERAMAGTDKGTMRQWDVRGRREVTSRTAAVVARSPHAQGVTCISYSAATRRMASASDDGVVALWAADE